jgi:hypothetical protein
MSAYPPEWEQYVVADQDGIPRMCGAVPRSLPCGVLVPAWYATNETCPAIPRDQWKSTPDMRGYEWNNRFQNGFPACCLAALSGCPEFIMARDNRKRMAIDWHKAWVALTGGRGGAAVDAALQYAMTKGLPLKDGSGVLKITEAWDVPSLDAIASGLLAGAMAVCCHDVHAECVVGLVMQGTTAYVQMVNSHYEGANAANNWHLFPLSRIELSTYGAMLIREIEFVPATGLIDAKG